VQFNYHVELREDLHNAEHRIMPSNDSKPICSLS